MGTEHLAIVWNPSKTERADLEQALQEASATGAAPARVSWWETTEDDPGQGAAAAAMDAGAEVIAAAGGDGTVRAVAEQVAQKTDAPVLGIIPLGTGNLLARNLDVPLGDLPAAFARVLAADARPIDLGWAEIALQEGTRRDAFAVMAGFGVDAHMIVETDDDLKDKAGWLAYVESLGRAVSASEVIDVKIAADGEPARTERAHTVLVGNCGTLQGGMVLLPDADPSDGELDMLLLSADGAAGWIDTLRTMVWDNGVKRLIAPGGRAESSDTVAHRRVTTLRLALTEPRVFEIDGEDVGETTNVDITVQRGAVRIC
ncbi:diacylglycerol/lipid kinase family protein [Microbacterium terrisoli]|uniref:diacylglycerol/lipid kinase family protein n=1 Tax=Microbacterium terrisoli TaxID=3242192 RepID=UPI002804E664|nr:diacylglycerol kinase family protein [Microbacterium protaetiae]